jgi:hypothetical protein
VIGKIRRLMVNFEFPRYEFKEHGKAEWVEISEITALSNLADTFPEVASALSDLLNGVEIKINNGICRARKSSLLNPGIDNNFSELSNETAF